MLKLLLLYYIDILKFNLPFSVMVGLLGVLANSFLNAFCFSFITGGFLLAIYFYNLRYKDQYYFYYNRGLRKVFLWGGCFIINVGIVFILKISFNHL